MLRTVSRIKLARVMAEISQTELARAVGVTPGAVSQWERGKTMPNVTRLKKVADKLGVRVEDLIEDQQKGA